LIKVSAINLEKATCKSSGKSIVGKFVWIKQIGMVAANRITLYQSITVITALNIN